MSVANDESSREAATSTDVLDGGCHEAIAISASVPVLLEYMQKVKNLDIAKAALNGVKNG